MNIDKRRRERCIAHTVGVLNKSYTPLALSPGMTVEHHANCSLVDDLCDYEECQIVREDSRGNGWWWARSKDGDEGLVHVQELLEVAQ